MLSLHRVPKYIALTLAIEQSPPENAYNVYTPVVTCKRTTCKNFKRVRLKSNRV